MWKKYRVSVSEYEERERYGYYYIKARSLEEAHKKRLDRDEDSVIWGEWDVLDSDGFLDGVEEVTDENV